MTAYAWPAGIVPKAMQMRVVPRTVAYTSPYSGQVQAVDLMGDYWRAVLELPPGIDPVAGGRLEAYFDRLKGQANQATFGHFKRPVPLGNARGTLTLASNAAALANTVTIAGTINRNLLTYGGFEMDTNADGMSDGWLDYHSGPTGTHDRPAGNGSAHSQGSYQAATVAGQLGISYFTPVPVVEGSGYALSIDVLGTQAHPLVLNLAWYDYTSVYLSQSSSTLTTPTSWARLSMVATAPPYAAYCIPQVWMVTDAVYGPSHLSLDNAQLELGSSATPYAGAPTLLAGDMLGINGQLVRVMADAVATDDGHIVVEIAPRLRAAQTAGASVTWNAPTANWLLMSDGAPVRWSPGMYDGPQVEFREAF